jgi:hypothetical protein
MSTARLRDWAATWRQIPPACDPFDCRWRGPFPRSERTWQLPEDAVDPACTIHGGQTGGEAA